MSLEVSLKGYASHMESIFTLKKLGDPLGTASHSARSDADDDSYWTLHICIFNCFYVVSSPP